MKTCTKQHVHPFADPAFAAAAGRKGAAAREARRAERLGDSREIIERASRKAASTLADLLDEDDAATRLAAALGLLTRVR